MQIKKILISFLLAAAFAPLASVNAQSLETMTSPLTNPVNFEDPRIQSEIRPIYVHHAIDNNFATEGGTVDIYALQLRVALTENLALIATKDGYVHFQPDTLLDDGSGFANLAGGLKYSVWSEADSIVSLGLRYEARTGEHEVLQGYGDGIINPFVSAAASLCDFNIIGYTGVRAAVSDEDSSFYDASLHVDTKIDWFTPLFEVNLYNVLSAGERLPLNDEGYDFFNLGSSLSEGNTMLTGAVGGRVDLAKDIQLGVAYELPFITDAGSDVTDWRLTSDLIYRF